MSHGPKFEPVDPDEHACLMSWNDFVESCQSGSFIDYDGFVELATVTRVSNVTISPSRALSTDYKRPKWATHVAWYNK